MTHRTLIRGALSGLSLTTGLTACSETLDVGWNEALDVNPPAGTAEPPSDEPDASSSPSPVTPVPSTDAEVQPLPVDGSDAPLDGAPLPLDAQVPIIVNNDGPFDNWQGEHMLLSILEGRRVLGLVINSSWAWPDLDASVVGWQEFIGAARADGVEGIPDPVISDAESLVRPNSGIIEDTAPNGSLGAQFIVDSVNALDAASPVLGLITGGRLTDVADAYLIDPGISERLVVISSLGVLSESGAKMGIPNGEMDAWADTIVAERLNYIQVSAYYDQSGDLPPERAEVLPTTALGNWIANKQPRLSGQLVACDQVAMLAATVPGFVSNAVRVTGQRLVPFEALEGPNLVRDDAGPAWLVTDIDVGLGQQRLLELLDRL